MRTYLKLIVALGLLFQVQTGLAQTQITSALNAAPTAPANTPGAKPLTGAEQAKTPTVHQPTAAEQPDTPAAKQPAAEQPNAPAAKQAAAEQPNAPPAKQPAAEQPNTPPAKQPAAEQPNAPAAKQPEAEQPNAPAAKQPAAEQPKTPPTPPSPKGCNNTATSDAVTGSIVQATGESLQRKRWQPQGGVMQFTLRTLATIPPNSSFIVCFRWKATAAENKEGLYVDARPDRLDRNNDGTTWTITTTIPRIFEKLPDDKKQDSAIPLVPLADVRILVLKEDKTPVADVATTIGITNPWFAIIYAIVTVITALFVLSSVSKWLLADTKLAKASWPLRIISTPTGHASLSQLQIALWTILVAASAVYVMALSGDLIEITNGTLVLLGIAGAAALGSKVHDNSQTTGLQAAAVTSQKSADEAKINADKIARDTSASQTQKELAAKQASDATERAEAAKDGVDKLSNPKAPSWYDLLVNEVTRDGVTGKEVDVTRFQLLLFTLIAAAFVLMNVVTTYVIPEIPTGFLTLMGISNGVYLGAKVAQS
jgi:hypothetical protein